MDSFYLADGPVKRYGICDYYATHEMLLANIFNSFDF